MTLRRVALGDGRSMHVRDEAPAVNSRHAEPSTAAVLLCVHGFPFDHSMWQFQTSDQLGNCRIIAPDLPGFGANEPITLADDDTGLLSMEQLADDLAQLLNALDVTRPVFFCGLSMGGYVAWQFWRKHRERLAGLILCDTRAAADDPQVAKARHYLADRVLREGPRAASTEMLQKVFAAQHLAAHESFVEATLSVMIGTDQRTLAAALRGMAARSDMTDQLASIQCPTQLLCGEHDRITPPDEMRAMAAAMPNAIFSQIAAAAHVSPLENPEAVNQAIAEFLSMNHAA